MSELTNVLIVVISALFGMVQLLFMYILRNVHEEIKVLRQRVHDLSDTLTRLDAIVESHFLNPKKDV